MLRTLIIFLSKSMNMRMNKIATKKIMKNETMEVCWKEVAKIRKATYEKWMYTESTPKYRIAATKAVCESTTQKIEIEVLDGLLLRLKVKNQHKSLSVQNHLLRRIVEKIQAQANHKKNGRTCDCSFACLSICCTSRCIKEINKKRWAA